MTAQHKSLVITAVVLIVLTALWLLKEETRPDESRDLRGAVLILLDTVRADHLSCYGYERETTPVLTELAKEGVLFEKVVAYAPWTLPSVVNILSGCPPDDLHVFDQSSGGLKQSIVQSIQNAGYTTAAVTEGGFVSRHFGFDRGFSEYYEEEGKVKLNLPGGPKDSTSAGGIENTFRRAGEWIEKHKDEKFFLFIQTYEPHTPYTQRTFTEGLDPGAVGEIFTGETAPLLRSGELAFNDSELEYLEALYDGGIRESDRRVGLFLDFLDAIGLGEQTLVVVTSDHGEELGAHYPPHCGSHGHSLRDDLVLVPLIIHNPLKSYSMKRVAHQARLMDVMPTIVEILGVQPEQPTSGRSLLGLMEETEKTNRLAYGGAAKKGPRRIFLRWMGYKYIKTTGPAPIMYPINPLPPAVQLYDLQADPQEQKNLAGAKPDIVRRMHEILTQTKEPGSQGKIEVDTDDMDETLRERLESLGYL